MFGRLLVVASVFAFLPLSQTISTSTQTSHMALLPSDWWTWLRALCAVDHRSSFADCNGEDVPLPDELKIYLLTLLDLPTLAAVSQLNRKWHQLAEQSTVWYALCVRDFRKSVPQTPPQNSTWKQMYREFSIPLEKDSRFHLCSYGFIGEQNAYVKLATEPVGTFLFRSSSTDPNAITVSFVNSSHIIRHRRMHKIETSYTFSDGRTISGVGYTFNVPAGYKRENNNDTLRLYKNYTELLNENPWMKLPLVSSWQKEFINAKGHIDIHCPDKVGPPSSAEIHYVAQMLQQNTTPVTTPELRIRANIYFGFKISNDDSATLVNALEPNRTILTFSVYHMDLNDTVCQSLCRVLQNNPTLSKIILHHCTYDVRELDFVVQALRLWLTHKAGRTLVLNDKTFHGGIVSGNNSNSNGNSNVFFSVRDFTSFVCQPWQCSRMP